jgi:hypothetical protein
MTSTDTPPSSVLETNVIEKAYVDPLCEFVGVFIVSAGRRQPARP